jgi:hypothetical protein
MSRKAFVIKLKCVRGSQAGNKVPGCDNFHLLNLVCLGLALSQKMSTNPFVCLVKVSEFVLIPLFSKPTKDNDVQFLQTEILADARQVNFCFALAGCLTRSLLSSLIGYHEHIRDELMSEPFFSVDL